MPIVNLAALAAAVAAAVPAQQEPPAAPVEPVAPQEAPAQPIPAPQISPRQPARSRAIGLPFRGRLAGGVPFPPQGPAFATWDPVLKRSPNRLWRRYATVRTVARILALLETYQQAHPTAPRVLVGDLSLPRGGPFGRRYGGLGHASHQNGLDVDVYYPRLDRLETAPRRAEQVDQVLAQDLVDLFLQAGAEKVFVGPNLELEGPREKVIPLVYHDDHLHARFGR